MVLISNHTAIDPRACCGSSSGSQCAELVKKLRPTPGEAARTVNPSGPKRSKSWWYYVLCLAAFFILTAGPYRTRELDIKVAGNVEARWAVAGLLFHSIATFGLMVTGLLAGLTKLVRDNQPAASANRSS